jgi:hypothetical protein
VELIALTAAGPRRLRGSTATYRLVDGGEAVVDGSGNRFRVVAGESAGHVDALTVEPAAVKASGWAATTDPPATAQQVVVFAGDRFLASVRPDVPRADLRRRYGARPAHAPDRRRRLCGCSRSSTAPRRSCRGRLRLAP